MIKKLLISRKNVIYDATNVSLLINLHMYPFFWKQNVAVKEKYKRICGEEIFNDVMLLLHEADKMLIKTYPK